MIIRLTFSPTLFLLSSSGQTDCCWFPIAGFILCDTSLSLSLSSSTITSVFIFIIVPSPGMCHYFFFQIFVCVIISVTIISNTVHLAFPPSTQVCMPPHHHRHHHQVPIWRFEEQVMSEQVSFLPLCFFSSFWSLRRRRHQANYGLSLFVARAQLTADAELPLF